jgi:hypothetical protein
MSGTRHCVSVSPADPLEPHLALPNRVLVLQCDFALRFEANAVYTDADGFYILETKGGWTCGYCGHYNEGNIWTCDVCSMRR